MYFRSETDVAKNLISNFFSNFEEPSLLGQHCTGKNPMQC